jgi:hypothetical protein
MSDSFGDSYKLPNGEEILLGQDLYGRWVVSCWDKDLNNRWEVTFDKLSEAKVEFERWRS